MEATAKIIVKVVISVLIATNLFGNTLVIMVVFKYRAMQSPMNYLLANLALADLLFGIFIIPLRLLSQEFSHPEGWVGELLCKVITHGNVAWFCSAASVMTLVFIAWERYHAILHPLTARGRLTRARLRKMVASTWISSAVFILPETWFSRFDEEKQSCIYDFPDAWLKLDSILWLFLVGVMPLSAMGFLYGRVVVKLWFNRLPTMNVAQRALLKSRKQVTRTVLTVTVILALCWIPNLIHYCLDSFKLIPKREENTASSQHSERLFRVITHILVATNTAVNPVIYSAHDQKFRRFVYTLLCRRSRHRNAPGKEENAGSTTLKNL